MIYCDLHTHSTFSDGTFTPEQIVKKAAELSLGAVALCDHNTTGGLLEFSESGKRNGVSAVPGIEISSTVFEKEVHVLGLFLKPEAFEKIESFCAAFAAEKDKSNAELIAKLNKKGFDISYDNLKSRFGKNINRAHIASELCKIGAVASMNEAFSTLLSKSGGLYTEPKKADFFDVLSLLKSVKAVSVLAHPLLNLSVAELETLLPFAKEAGLCAIETIYPLFSPEQSALCAELAKKNRLLQSGGSDFHGSNKPDISLGTGKGELKVPFEFFQELERLAERFQKKTNV